MSAYKVFVFEAGPAQWSMIWRDNPPCATVDDAIERATADFRGGRPRSDMHRQALTILPTERVIYKASEGQASGHAALIEFIEATSPTRARYAGLYKVVDVDA